MTALVSLAVAKQHLRITDDYHDADVQQKVDAATDSIVKYLAAKADPTWTDATVPPVVAQCVLILLNHLYDPGRGDVPADPVDVGRRPAPWDTIDALLVQLRESAIA
jgi:hypothetical protein